MAKETLKILWCDIEILSIPSIHKILWRDIAILSIPPFTRSCGVILRSWVSLHSQNLVVRYWDLEYPSIHKILRCDIEILSIPSIHKILWCDIEILSIPSIHKILWCDIEILSIPSIHKIRTLTWRLRSSRPEVFCAKGVLRNFAKFKGKHLC